jgi:ribosomal protein L37AE/L43A
MREKLARFMMGRYGSDQLGQFIVGFSIFTMILSLIFRGPVLQILVVLLLTLTYYRMLSKDISKRYAENQKFLAIKGRFFGYFKNMKARSQQRKTYHIYSCPTCKQKIRIPKGKGKICITCPKCKAEFIKKS